MTVDQLRLVVQQRSYENEIALCVNVIYILLQRLI